MHLGGHPVLVFFITGPSRRRCRSPVFRRARRPLPRRWDARCGASAAARRQSASLDAPTEDALFRRYLDAARRTAAGTGAITILVSHRFSTVRMADLIVVMDGGRVVQAGDHATLLAEGGLYAELFELQARSYL
ncbi:hypothetical protein ABZ914_27040 [Spirillospora sp. NPDC046719]